MTEDVGVNRPSVLASNLYDNGKAMKSAVLSFALLGLVATGFAQESALRKQLDGAYKELHAGFETKSTARLKKFFDRYGHPQFVYIGVKGERQTAQDLLKTLGGGMSPSLKVVKSKATIDRLKLQGDTATVGTAGEWKMVFANPDGKKQTLEGKTLMTDTWVKTPGGWKLKQSKVDSEKMTSDGKPYAG